MGAEIMKMDEPLVVSTMLTLVGLLVALAAEKLPPNPLLGFRIGYTFVSRRTWTQANRVAGLAMAALGLLATGASMIDPPWGILVLNISLPMLLVALVEYAERLAEKQLIAEPLTPGEGSGEPLKPLGLARITLPVAIIIAIVYMIVVLRLDRIYALQQLVNQAAFLGIHTLTLYSSYLGIRRPEAFHVPWLTLSENRRVASAIIISLLLVSAYVALSTISCFTRIAEILKIAGITLAACATSFTVMVYLCRRN
ncbi:hypothetical protein Pdsh_04440 [Pyrodictium delaneyi]|uniref:SdpI family protein n=1 Tax=Pyrodictium delaneyi TaxID=1273541 RepID=A0A211YPM4_9CREN|nr:hypothetical protein Pdsh_04440 [Pyrodictium delaneyi]